MEKRVDVLILGGGLAGLSLARQLLLTSSKSVLLIEKRDQIPPRKQKVGEATVQLSAYYFSKVLDLEEHLLKKHLLKYNLRFYWKTAGANEDYECYSQSYIRQLSNLATYQLDRNLLEEELLRLNSECPNFDVCSGTSDLVVDLETNPHRASFRSGSNEHRVEAEWVVDTTGRSTFLARQLSLAKANPIRHGTSFFWVEGLVNIEKLTCRPPVDIRLNPQRCQTGHFPAWLATNHFVGEGFWLWVIPLPGKTSIGLVYDRERVPSEEVNTPAKLVKWASREFPLFRRELQHCRITDHGSYSDFSYDCRQTLSEKKWAISGEAGRFSDPLYSPGGDLIALYNTLIADCIQTDTIADLKTKTRMYEVMMQAFYEAYVPSYAVSYDLLGDQECFSLKYAWELAVYFTFLVFPFINDLFVRPEFIRPYLRELSKLGKLNRDLQNFLLSYYEWKKPRKNPDLKPLFFELTELGPLRHSEQMFYKVGVSSTEALDALTGGMSNLQELARYIVTYVHAAVTEDASLLLNRKFVEQLDLSRIDFDAEGIRGKAFQTDNAFLSQNWSFDPWCMRCFQNRRPAPLKSQNWRAPQMVPAECPGD